MVPTKAALSSDLGKESGATDDVDKSAEQKAEEDSITDEVAELRTPETARKQLEWASILTIFLIAYNLISLPQICTYIAAARLA